MTTFIETALEGNRLQADYFWCELQRALREAEAEFTRLSAAMAGQPDSEACVRRIRKALKSVDRERRQLTLMLQALGHRYPGVQV